MFYSQFILAKKGPLGTIWIAAHLERKLRKNQVADTDIGVSVDSILFPEVPIALRLSSHLLLGVVRIYSRKVNYLFDDCSEALLKIKQAFRSTAVDLPPEESTAPYHSITLPETFDLDDFELPDSDILQGNYVDHHVSTREQITLQDTMEGVVFTTSQFGLDERFGDGDTSQIGLDLDEVLLNDKAATLEHDDIGASPQMSHQNDEKKEEFLLVLFSDLIGFEQIDDLPSTAEVREYAEGPSTPGLEEPNLFGTQMDQCNNEQKRGAGAFSMSGFLSNIEISKSEGQSCLLDNAQVSNVISPIGSPGRPEVVDVEAVASQEPKEAETLNHLSHEALQPTESVLRPCTSHPGHPSLPFIEAPLSILSRISILTTLSVIIIQFYIYFSRRLLSREDSSTSFRLNTPKNCFGIFPFTKTSEHEGASEGNLLLLLLTGEKCHVDVSNPALSYQETMVPSVCEGTPDLGKTDMQIESLIFNENVESVNKSAATDMPEPEKLLSLAYPHDGEANDLLMTSTPDIHGASEGHTGAAGVNCISGKKRSFTESTLTVQSMDFFESYGGVQSKRTTESVPDDDDLLSSILVGRKSSVLKMKPSPAAPEIASMKRTRSAPRTSALKRKVLMDDMMVLHGDTIRQQLTNTEDIRRIRKKAPCTSHEILMIQRQFLEDEIFHEPIFTDLSTDLTILRNETFDLTGIKVSDNYLDSSHVEKTNIQESYSRTNTEIHGMEGNNEPMAVQLQEDAEVQPTEMPVLSENHQSEVNLGSHDIDAHGHTNIISHVEELDSSQNVVMNNVGGNIAVSEAENCSIGPGNESSSLIEVLENDFAASLTLMDKTNDLVGSIHTDILSIPNAQNMNTFPILEVGLLNEDQIIASGMECDDKDARSGSIFIETAKVDCLQSETLGLDEKESALKDEENPVCQEAGLLSTMCPEIIAARSPLVDQNDENDMIANDTEFLNVGDDDIIDDDDDYQASAEGTHLENSGWSSRTRAVAKYLQTVFDKEELHGRQELHLDNLLVGKTRKEASRMFFETLVLKTRDYVHVEQTKPFANINIKPRMKLMKSDF
uniref:Sister chromatid cohesion 1 protein 3 n=1 Tax=Cajanus cajan TaxID=3821 RepID=A0A151TAY3_CAJCA|nr:Sister chromatid cohesion 1 protein 3 [Cajanus cajan]